MGKALVYLSLGSNLGDRKENLRQAICRLQEFIEQTRVSSIYETLPLYVTDQPKFLNVVACGYTRLRPRALLQHCLEIEIRMGRDRKGAIPRGPRMIDIDILLYGDRILREAELSIPHPQMLERRFVLQPLLELNPNGRDPGTGRLFSRYFKGLEDQGVYIFSAWDYTRAVSENGCEHPQR